MAFKPALVLVDVQEDFCPPKGSLAVEGGRDIAPTLNQLLSLPFPLKIATQDWHPQDHISFASNHPPPNNKPFESMITIANPNEKYSNETEHTRLWPVHCVQNTFGAQLIPELEKGKVHQFVKKGDNKDVEMYSAFADPFPHPYAKSNLAKILHDADITDVYVAGLAADYCVRYTALDAQKEGFHTFVVGEATKAVDPSSMDAVFEEYKTAGVKVISKDDVVERVKECT